MTNATSRHQTWNNLLVEELENLKMKQRSDKQLDSSLLQRQQQELEVTGDHRHSRHKNDDEEVVQ